jgi:hypothetical protein
MLVSFLGPNPRNGLGKRAAVKSCARGIDGKERCNWDWSRLQSAAYIFDGKHWATAPGYPTPSLSFKRLRRFCGCRDECTIRRFCLRSSQFQARASQTWRIIARANLVSSFRPDRICTAHHGRGWQNTRQNMVRPLGSERISEATARQLKFLTQPPWNLRRLAPYVARMKRNETRRRPVFPWADWKPDCAGLQPGRRIIRRET